MSVEKQVNVVISAVDKYSGAMTLFDKSWEKVAIGAFAAEAAIIAASIAAAKLAIDIGKNVFAAATDFYDAVFDIEAVASSFGTTASEISGVLDDLVNKFPVTGKEGGEALQLIAQMGYGAEEQLAKVSDAAMTLSIATATDLRTSAEGTMAIMNAFGLELEEVDRVINLLAATSFTSAASVSDLREAMKFAASTSALAGVSLEETAAILGRLKDKGLEASQAGTTYRMAMVQVTKESQKGVDALKKYGLTYDDVNPSVVGLTGMIEAFDGAILSADDAQDIFGTRAKAIALVVNDGAEAFKEYTKTITGTQAAYEAAEIKLGKWSVVMDNVGGSMDIFKKTIAAGLVPALIDFVGKTEKDGIRGVITQLMELEKESGVIGQPMIDLFKSLKDSADNLFEDAFGDVEGFYNWLSGISGALSKNIEIIAIWGGAFAEAFVGATDEGDELKSMLTAVNMAFTGLSMSVAIVYDLFQGFFYMMNLGWDTVEYAAFQFNSALSAMKVVMFGLLDALPFADMTKEIEKAKNAVKFWGEEADNAFDTEAPKLMMATIAEASIKAQDAIREFGKKGKEAVEKVTDEVALTSKQVRDLGTDFEVVKGKIVKLPEGAKKVTEEFSNWSEGAEYAGLWIDKTKDKTKDLTASTKEVTKAAKETEKVLSETAKHELALDSETFKSDLKIAEQRAKSASDLIQNQLEWEAKIDITEIEAAADIAVAEAGIMEAAFNSVADSISAISSGQGALTSLITDGDLWMSEKNTAWNLIKSQISMQQDLVDAQVDLLEAQKKNIEAKTESEKDGKADISVEVLGDTEGWLKGLMQSLFEEIMVKAQTEAFSCFGVE